MKDKEYISQWMQELQPLTKKLLEENQSIRHKPDGTPVTTIDTQIEQFLREKIQADLPEDGIIGEEFPPHQAEAPRQWVIDPIDGTRALIGGFPTYTVLLALLEKEKPKLSTIFQPVTGENWIGEHARRTELNGEPVQCRSQVEKLEEACFATTSTLLVGANDKPLIESIMQKAAYYQLGGDGYAYGKLASGTVDLIIESGMQPYDFIPLIPVVTGAGGIITDWQGNSLTLKSKGDVIAASSEALHQEALALLNAA